MEKMKGEFRLVGLGLPNQFTCTNECKENINEDVFWPKSIISKDRFQALFDWAKKDKGFWNSRWIAVIEHDGFTWNQVPKNAVVLEIKEQTI